MRNRPNSPVGPPQDQQARLIRNNRVRVLNCGGAGCLLETGHPVAVNTVAGLQVWFGARMFEDVVRVVRCESIVASSNIYRVAVEFLSVTPAYAGSLRYLLRGEISQLEGLLDARMQSE
jgi:hypothetical protein